jgi:hypothetical protein
MHGNRAVSINYRRQSFEAKTAAEKRTHENYVPRKDLDRTIVSFSLFESLRCVDMIYNFVLKQMHLLDEGVTKKSFFHLYFQEKKGSKRLTTATEVSKRIIELKRHIRP